LTVKVWRQESRGATGRFESYDLKDISVHASFLEMLDVLNEQLVADGQEPVAFDHDCREGICGSCGVVINGQAHGPDAETATCQLHMRRFKNGDTLFIEPWRAEGFPVIKDLFTDRSSFDRIMSAGGYVSVNTGSAVDANSIPVPREDAEEAFDAAACIGCGACVAACPNSAAMLFRQLHQPLRVRGRLPQGHQRREHRAPEPRLPEGDPEQPQISGRSGARERSAGRRPLPPWHAGRDGGFPLGAFPTGPPPFMGLARRCGCRPVPPGERGCARARRGHRRRSPPGGPPAPASPLPGPWGLVFTSAIGTRGLPARRAPLARRLPINCPPSVHYGGLPDLLDPGSAPYPPPPPPCGGRRRAFGADATDDPPGGLP
jgi:succinate dehydrogenase / fumarate reductase iron-sulfur subunit